MIAIDATYIQFWGGGVYIETQPCSKIDHGNLIVNHEL